MYPFAYCVHRSVLLLTSLTHHTLILLQHRYHSLPNKSSFIRVQSIRTYSSVPLGRKSNPTVRSKALFVEVFLEFCIMIVEIYELKGPNSGAYSRVITFAERQLPIEPPRGR